MTTSADFLPKTSPATSQVGVIDQISDTSTQANLSAASAILAGLRLENEVIYRALRRDIMQESSVYRSILAERRLKGEEEKQREIAIKSLVDAVVCELEKCGVSIVSPPRDSA